jgi:hypothetical protein|tara:strand:+ start:9285 stop:12800 length:3516 start_codon:yes stop_codon:yes gene_type:complete
MAFTSCSNLLLDADLDGLSTSDKKSFIKALDDFIQKSKSNPPTGFNGLDAGSQKIIKRLRDEFRLQREINYHDELRNIVIRESIINRAMGSKDPLRYLLNMLEGGHGQRLSVDYQGKSNGGRMVTLFLSDLEKADLLTAFRDGKIEKEIFQDLDTLYKKHEFAPNTPKDLKASGNPQAKKIAEIIFYHDKTSVNRLNSSNAKIVLDSARFISKVPDQLKVRGLGKTKEEAWTAWRKLADEHFDLDQMFDLIPDHMRDAHLREIFGDYYDGVHIQSKAGDDLNFKFINPSNLGRKVSRRNRIIYKNGVSTHAYLEKVGYKGFNIQHAVTFGLEHDGRNHALLENLGTNPQAMLASVVEELGSRMKKEGLENYDKFSIDMLNQRGRNKVPKKLMDSLEILNGTTRSPVNVKMAAITGSVRAFKNMALLGFATVRSLNDVVTMSFSTKKNGIPFSRFIRKAPHEFLKAFEIPLLGIKADAQKRRVASLIGLGPRALVADVVGKFGADDALPGFITKMQRNYFKMNLLTYWNDAMKTSFSMMLSNHLALEAGKETPMMEVQRLLKDFDISDAEWDIIRRTRWKADDGNWYLSPDRLDDDSILSNEDIESLLRLESDKSLSMDNIETFIADETTLLDGRIVNVKEKIADLREKIARIKLKKSPEDIKLRDRYDSELDDLEKVHGEGGIMSEGFLNKQIQKYMSGVKNKEDFDRFTSRALKKHYQTKEGAELAAKVFLQGMDKNIRDEFISEFADHWRISKGKGNWSISDLRESINMKLKGEKPKRPRDPKKYPPEADPKQDKFKFLADIENKESQEAWGQFLSIMSEDEAHLNWLHKEIQKSWRSEADVLFKGYYDKSGKWRAPAIYNEGVFSPGQLDKLQKRAADLESESEKLKGSVPKWMDEFIKDYLSKKIRTEDVARKRNMLSTKLSTLFYDRNDYAVIIPGAKEKRLMTQGQRSGTILGEAIRFMTQFKTFPVTLMTKSLQQEMNGKALGEMNTSEWGQLIKFIIGMTMMGAVTTVATDFLRNKTTRETFDPTDDNFLDFTTSKGLTNLLDAFVYGGGAGLYGDIMAQPYGSSKNFSATKSLLGPVLSQYDDIIDVTLGVLNGDKKAKKAYGLILQNTPGANLFYAKTGFDYLLNYQMQDIIDPGYHSKQRARMRESTGQTNRFGTRGFFQ